jgi:hypothetical protein
MDRKRMVFVNNFVNLNRYKRLCVGATISMPFEEKYKL